MIDLLRGEPLVERAECDILLDSGREQLVVRVLKDEPYHVSHFSEVLLFDLETHYFDESLSTEDAVQVKRECGLAGAVRPHDADGLIAVHNKVDRIQRPAAVGVRVV